VGSGQLSGSGTAALGGLACSPGVLQLGVGRLLSSGTATALGVLVGELRRALKRVRDP